MYNNTETQYAMTTSSIYLEYTKKYIKNTKSEVGLKHLYINKTPQLSDMNSQLKNTGLEHIGFNFRSKIVTKSTFKK